MCYTCIIQGFILNFKFLYKNKFINIGIKNIMSKINNTEMMQKNIFDTKEHEPVNFSISLKRMNGGKILMNVNKSEKILMEIYPCGTKGHYYTKSNEQLETQTLDVKKLFFNAIFDIIQFKDAENIKIGDTASFNIHAYGTTQGMQIKRESKNIYKIGSSRVKEKRKIQKRNGKWNYIGIKNEENIEFNNFNDSLIAAGFKYMYAIVDITKEYAIKMHKGEKDKAEFSISCMTLSNQLEYDNKIL